MPITQLPIPPSRRDSPDVFSTRADALLGALPDFVDEANALAENVSEQEQAASDSASDAASSAAAAAASSALADSALASMSVINGLAMSTLTTETTMAVASSFYVLAGGVAQAIILPGAPTPGDVVAVMVANGRKTNMIGRNAALIQGLAEDMQIDDANAVVTLRYVDGTVQWRLI